MNKSVIIIDAYIPTPEKELILKDCILSVRRLGFDIILVSHSIVSEKIISLVDYYVYDKDNIFNKNNVYGWTLKNNIEIRINITESHEYPIIKSIRSSISLAKALGYDFFYFTEFDHIYSDTDINEILHLKNRMTVENKDFIVFYPTEAIFGDIKGLYYETSFFGGKVEKFLNIFNSFFPNSLEEYNNNFTYKFPNCLEHFFYKAFSPYEDKMILTKEYVRLYFKDSQINLSSYQNIKINILPSEDNNPYLYISNNNSTPYEFEIIINNKVYEKYTISNQFLQGDFILIPLKENSTIKIITYQEGNLLKEQEIFFNKDKIEEYKKIGIIIFHNKEDEKNIQNGHN